MKEPGCQHAGTVAGKKPTVVGNYPNRVKIKKRPMAQPVSRIRAVFSRLSNYSLRINLVVLEKKLDLNLKRVKEKRIKAWKIFNFI